MLRKQLPPTRSASYTLLFGKVLGVIGLYASYYLDVVSGAAIVFTARHSSSSGMAWKLIRAAVRTPAPG
ncbi:MAG: hypothetical protein ABSG85_18840 [Spirochaetia bacterium]